MSNQLQLFQSDKQEEQPMGDQVVARLIMYGIYPFYSGKYGFIYLINEQGNIIGTGQSTEFNTRFNRQILYLSEHQMTPEQIKELKKYRLSDADKIGRIGKPDWV